MALRYHENKRQVKHACRKDTFHHLRRGNASMTYSHNSIISGIFVLDCVTAHNHALFLNPYATQPIPDNWFPGVKRFAVTKDSSEEKLRELANITFWCFEEEAP
jgi:hypothetical protein